MGTTVKPRFMVPPVAIVAAGAETFRTVVGGHDHRIRSQRCISAGLDRE
jgi:hypothetical protein